MLKLFVLALMVAWLSASPVENLLENLEDERELLLDEIEALQETQEQKKEIAQSYKSKYGKTCGSYLAEDVFGSKNNACPSGFVRMDLRSQNKNWFRIKYRSTAGGEDENWTLEQELIFGDTDSLFYKQYGKKMKNKYEIKLYCNPAKCSEIALKKLCFLTYGVYNISLNGIPYTKSNSEDQDCKDNKPNCVSDGKVKMNLSTETPCNFNCAFFKSYQQDDTITFTTEPATPTSYIQAVAGTACVKKV